MYLLRPNTDRYQTYIRQSTEVLAKSLFVLYLLLVLFMFISVFLLVQGGMLKVSPVRVGVGGVLLIPIGWLFNKLLRTDPKQWMKGSRWFVWMFTNPIVNLLVTAVIGQVVIFVMLFDSKFSTGTSSIVLCLFALWLSIMWGIVSYPMVRSLLEHPVWMLTTSAIGIAVLIFYVVQVNKRWLIEVNREQRVLVATSLHSDDGVMDVDNYAYWSEYFDVSRPLVPYIGYRSYSSDGNYIKIDASGVRHSVDLPIHDDAVGDVTIHFYGGSTMWGYGVADDGTIPSWTATFLHNDHIYNIDVTNFADIGYNSFNDISVFNSQLLNGNIPDIAVFYQGYNDIAMGLARRGYIGTENNEHALARIPLQSAEQYADYYTRYVNTLQTIGDANAIEIVFVWQPMWMNKPLTEYEQHTIIESGKYRADAVGDIYAQVNPYIESLSDMPEIPHFLNYVDLFVDDTDTIFMDIVHITGTGNQRVAEALSTYIFENILKLN